MRQVGLSIAEDASIQEGNVIQLFSNHTQGVLAFNINEAILGEETYAVTSSPQRQPALRNAFRIELAGESPSTNICYGDKIRLTCHANERKVGK